MAGEEPGRVSAGVGAGSTMTILLGQPAQPAHLDQSAQQPPPLDQNAQQPSPLDQNAHQPAHLDQNAHQPAHLDQGVHQPAHLDQGVQTAHWGQNAWECHKECAPTSVKRDTMVHWSRHLKCQVCFSYLRQPHTLPCGHSFCKICLVRLGQTSRESSPEISVRHLCLPCPTCRSLFPALAVLRGHAITSFLIQQLIADWKKERKRMKSQSTTTFRSICTQTAHHRTHQLRRRKSLAANAAELDLHEQFHTRVRLDDLYYRSLTAHSSDSSEDNEAAAKATPATDPYLREPSVNGSDTSTVSSGSSLSGPGFVFGRRFQELGHLGVGQRLDWSPGRVLLMSVWCMYSMVVVGIAQPMLPYMVLVTLFFLVLILR